MSLLLAIIRSLFILLPSAFGDEADLEDLMNKMTSDVRDFAAEIERVYSDRCTITTLEKCTKTNYDECLSEYPNQYCPGGNVFSVPSCGDGIRCGGLFDFTVSSVSLPAHVTDGEDGNPSPSNMEVKEEICYSRQAEKFMVERFDLDKNYWRNMGVDSPQKFFGTTNGALRIHPARASEQCGAYDATKRPWYIAASSGPKDVVLILDTSGSMQKQGRLELMKQAASTVIGSLTVGDHVTVVAFSSEARNLTTYLVQATKENKDDLIGQIEILGAVGSTNFMAAFDKAYDVLELSRRNEMSSFCHTAILFLTDGMMTVPSDIKTDDVTNLIARREREVKANAFIFLYGLGSEANQGDAASLLKTISCATGGMWSHVEDGGRLSEAMGNYYKLFALGLGDDENEDFAAWVDPYPYATGNVMGTTVSAPVYDRSVSPHLLVGVVGVDFTMAAMDTALGVSAGSRETLQKLVKRSTAVCPQLNLTECTIQSLRFSASGREALCPSECTNFVGT